jgi:hypothetical protein
MEMHVGDERKGMRKMEEEEEEEEYSPLLNGNNNVNVNANTAAAAPASTHHHPVEASIPLDRDKSISYVFTGKLSILPLVILFLATGAGSLLAFGDKPYNAGYFTSTEVYYGIAGVVLSVVCLGLIVIVLVWLVVKISIQFTPHNDRLILRKRGVFRSSVMEFVLSESTLHYCRSHFSDDQCWLALVVKERAQYHKIMSWKGRGNQRDRFMRLFQHLQQELIRAQSIQQQMQQRRRFGLGVMMPGGIMYWSKEAAEIVSKEEATLIAPFTPRLRALRHDSTLFNNSTSNDRSSARTDTASVCLEDVNFVSYDHFFSHFSKYKRIAAKPSIMSSTTVNM